MPNGGAWRKTASGAGDDHHYLVQVIQDLRRRSIRTGNTPVFLAGLSNGGGMALSAALRAPDRYQRIAALMPTWGERPPGLERSSGGPHRAF